MGDTLVLLNARAGTLIDAGAERVRDALLSSLKGHCARTDILLLKPRDLVPEIRRPPRSRFSTIVVGGGDGSVSAAAQALPAPARRSASCRSAPSICSPATSPCRPISRRRSRRWVLRSRARSISRGSTGALPFAVGARLLQPDGERARGGEGASAGTACRRRHRGVSRLPAYAPFTLDIRTDHHREHVQALAVLITNNRFSPSWRRAALDEGVLEIHIAEHSDALSKLRASANLLTGAWRNDDDSDGIRTLTARHVAIGRTRTHSWAATDGELYRARHSVALRIGARRAGRAGRAVNGGFQRDAVCLSTALILHPAGWRFRRAF